MNISSIRELATVLPTNLKNEISNLSTPWGISEDLFARLKNSGLVKEEGTAVYRKTQVLPTDPEWGLVWKYFSHDLSNR